MLTKKEVTNWVYRVRDKAFRSLQDAYEKAVKEEEDRIFKESGLPEIIQEMDKLLLEVNRKNNEMSKILKNSGYMSYTEAAYYGLTYYLNKIDNIEHVVRNHIDFESRKLTQLKNRYEDDKRNVEANYAAVLAELKLKSNVKRCMEYLKELGFDVSSLEKLEHTEVAVQLDRRYLFVCGDNK